MEIIIHITAEELGISKRTLDQWAKSGRIKYERGRGWRLFDPPKVEEIKTWLLAHLKKRGE